MDSSTSVSMPMCLISSQLYNSLSWASSFLIRRHRSHKHLFILLRYLIQFYITNIEGLSALFNVILGENSGVSSPFNTKQYSVLMGSLRNITASFRLQGIRMNHYKTLIYEVISRKCYIFIWSSHKSPIIEPLISVVRLYNLTVLLGR